jgi:hypothetical protein
VYGLRSEGVGCATARAVASGSRRAGTPFDVRLHYWSRHFHCRGRFVEPPSGGAGPIHFRCVRRTAIVTFNHQ